MSPRMLDDLTSDKVYNNTANSSLEQWFSTCGPLVVRGGVPGGKRANYENFIFYI